MRGGSVQQNSPPKAETPIPTDAATNANLTVTGVETFQTMDGMGVNVNVNSWNGGQLAPALNLLVATNGSSINTGHPRPEGLGHERVLDSGTALDLFTLQQVYELPNMQDIWNTIGV